MNNRITASYDTLVKQAPMTIHEYMFAGIRSIDQAFGQGYAKAHPELLAAFIEAAQRDFSMSTLVQTLQDGVDDISEAIRSRG